MICINTDADLFLCLFDDPEETSRLHVIQQDILVFFQMSDEIIGIVDLHVFQNDPELTSVMFQIVIDDKNFFCERLCLSADGTEWLCL